MLILLVLLVLARHSPSSRLNIDYEFNFMQTIGLFCSRPNWKVCPKLSCFISIPYVMFSRFPNTWLQCKFQFVSHLEEFTFGVLPVLIAGCYNSSSRRPPEKRITLWPDGSFLWNTFPLEHRGIQSRKNSVHRFQGCLVSETFLETIIFSIN